MIPMHGIEQTGAAGALLAWVAQAVVFGTLLALVTAVVVSTLRKRLNPSLHGALWMVVLLKFVLPVGPGWSLSMASVTQRLAAPVHAPTPTASNEIVKPQLIFFASNENVLPVTASAAPRDWLGIGISAVAILYVACLLFIAARRIRGYRRFARECRQLPLAEESVTAVVSAVCRRVGLRCEPMVRISEEAPAPFIFGLRRPTLVLSRRQLVRPDELEAVVLHEIAHLRRGDMFVRYIQWIAGTWLFFWPVVAWVNRRIDLAREAACDEWALRHGRLSAGEYARCLLRALQPGGARRMSYLPAAMAANLETVERRIEMIMDTTKSRWTRGSLSLPALAMLAAWAGFALCGASAADEPKPQTVSEKEEAKTETKSDGQTKTIVVTKVADSGSEADVDKAIEEALKDLDPQMREHIKAQMAKEGGRAMAHRVMIQRKAGGPIGGQGVAMFDIALDETDMAEFAKTHPTADANADGKVTRTEHDAFVIAVALTDTPAVLAKFPAADRNKDKQLDATEIARWMSMGGQQDCVKFVQAGVCATDDAPAPQKQEVRVNVVRKAEMAVGQKRTSGHWSTKPPGDSPAKWVVDNIKAEPAASDVARYVSLVEETPRAMFLEANPEADVDKDGKLTDEEQEQFLHVQMSKWMHEAHPELDVNKDGVLSHEEMAALHGKGGTVKVLKLKTSIKDDNGTTKDSEKTIVLEGNEDDEGEIVIELDEEEVEGETQP